MATSGEGKSTVNVGMAAYGGQMAVGVALAHRVRNVVINGGIGVSGGKRHLVRLGAGWQF